MPNHCLNVLKLEDSSKKMVELLRPYISKDAHGEDFIDLQKIYPMPKSIEKTTARNPAESEQSLQALEEENLETYGHKDWYTWCVANWGTKWNTYENNFNKNSVVFSSAWSPPIGALKYLAIKTQENWILEYIEEGSNFIGITHLTPNGIEDSCYTLEDAPEALKKSLGYEPYNEEDELKNQEIENEDLENESLENKDLENKDLENKDPKTKHLEKTPPQQEPKETQKITEKPALPQPNL